MAIILEAVGASGDVQTLPLSGAATRVQALPGLQYRLRDTEGGRIADGARVKRVGDDLVVEGLPGDASVSLEGFFTRCAPGDACSLSMENIGGSAGEAILPSTQPVGAFADGSFLMYASGAAAPQLPTAPEAETDYKPILGGLAGLAVVGGGGGGGGGSSSDTTPPPAPVITSGEFTKDERPVIAGTAEAGATVTITLDAGSDGTSDVSYAVQADANGAWTVDTATATPIFGALPALAEGVPTEIRALARDAAGNASPTTIASLILDTIAPGQPTITSALLTNDATPVIRGAADAGSIVTVGLDLDRNGSVDVSWRTVAGSLGTYLVDLGSAPASGTLPGGALGDVSTTNLVVVASDLAGNASAPATAVLNVDTRLPDAPVIVTIAGDNAINAAEAAGSITISGTISEPDRPVTFQWGGLTETFTSSGTTWSVTVSTGAIPADGLQTVIVTYVGAAGSTSIEGRQDVLVDRVTPGAPSLSLVSASDTGTPGDGITSDDTPTIRIDLAGTGAQAGDTVSLFSGAATVGGALLDDADIAAGYVEVTTNTLGADGIKSLTATITDAAVNVSSASPSLPLTIDRTAPTVAITDNVGGTATGPVTFTFTFSEPVLGFTADDVAVTGGTKGEFAQTGAATYTLVVTPPADTNGQMSVSVPGGAATDIAGTPNTASAVAVQNFALAVPPTVAITDNAGGTTNAPVTFTFTFSEPVTGFTVDDVAVVNGTKGTFAQTGATTYTLVVTPPSGSVGTMTVTVPAGAASDLTGNASVGPVSATQAFDTAPPTLSITDNVEGVASGTVTFIFTFSEPVSGFASGDITVIGGDKGTFAQTGATEYTLVVIPEPDTVGTITVSVGAGAAMDTAGNASLAAGPVTQSYDTAVAPTLTITDNGGDVANGSVTFTFTFSEPVTGFTVDDVAVVNGTKGTFAQTGATTYTLVVTPPSGSVGTMTVTVPAGAASDLTGNASVGPVSAAQAFDTDAPGLTVSNDAGSTATGDVTFTFSFDEAVFGFDAADVSVTNGAKGSFTGVNGASVYTLVVSPDDNEEGTLTASVSAGAGTDAAGNGTPAGSSSVAFDTAAPSITITQILDDAGDLTGVVADGGTTDDPTPTLTLNFSELLTVEILRNGEVIDSLTPIEAADPYVDNTFPAIEGASYTYTARMTDAAGNVGLSDPYTIIFQTAISG